MASGYDKFFKDARTASGLSQAPKKKTSQKTSSAASATSRASMLKKGQGAKASANLGADHRKMSPEERLREELALRMKQRRQQIIKKRQNFPVIPALITLVTFIAGVAMYYNSDALEERLDHFLGRIEIGVMGRAVAAPSSAKKTEDPAAKSAKTATPENSVKPQDTPNIKQWTAEEVSFFSKLNERKVELDQREADLAKLEEELQKRKSELDEKLKQLEAVRADISAALKARVANDQEKVAKLVEFYSNMKPQQAAKIIETLNEDLAVEVLDKMKKKNAAEVMNLIDAKKARRLSELLTGYQRTPAGNRMAQDQADTQSQSDGQE